MRETREDCYTELQECSKEPLQARTVSDFLSRSQCV